MVGAVEQMVPIGRFSKMTRLSLKALRHYDEIGLLVPAKVDPSSGYRYYRLSQANEAEAIRTLRSLDMPLDEIGEALATDDPEVSGKVLDAHRRRLAGALAENRRRLGFIERLIRTEDPIVHYTVTTLQVPDQTVLSLRSRATWEDVGDVIQAGFGTLAGALGAAGRTPSGQPFIVFHDVIDAETAGELELCIPIEEPAEPDRLPDRVRSRTVDGGLVASTVHRGPYDEIAPAYHVLTGWIQEHGHQPSGPPREVYLDDPTLVAPGEQRTEVQWPIH